MTAPRAPRIRVLIVDDSAVVRKHLSERLEAAGIEVVATASDPLFAWPKLRSLQPDVLVLDVEMPRMDGISFLKEVMAEQPTPVVMCSTLTEAGCAVTLQALAAGAVGFVTKPKAGLKSFLEDPSNDLVDTVRSAARANLGALGALPQVARTTPLALPPGGPATAPPPGAPGIPGGRVIAMGLSTGGVQSIEVVLRALPVQTPGIVIVQHMPAGFTASLAARLNSLCDIEVAEARHGERVLPGRALIAPGGRHMRLRRQGSQFAVEVVDGPLINHHRPSVDVLFRSVAQQAGAAAIGVIMTGMGDDGARGLRDMHDAGALTAAQDQASSVVFGMPKEAIRLGAADAVLPLPEIAPWLLQQARVAPGQRVARAISGVSTDTSPH
ncbi:chemotaxis response regulator protein-glutamate methylesterase [Ideonella sp. 4Y11]|uniref:Protein-glutamate methylesterase/protein-glutamine glutaminase n=1 Tax=Ideonella aquatica TaxID=2824119 RepID=A0A941BFF2_9BURK|nr:chemotaxis response regulator protein-glutamate methylesterase [Ideonella aquatica]MBQ0958706.1 chemotaxis response regulator protein-glutamate methylesterase [Ideonella aquatica]